MRLSSLACFKRASLPFSRLGQQLISIIDLDIICSRVIISLGETNQIGGENPRTRCEFYIDIQNIPISKL